MATAAKQFDPEKYNFTKGFPTRENCNLSDPKEMFLWMLAALPGVRGAQLVMPVSYNMVMSEHLHECGARLAAEPVKKYQPPAANEPHWLTSPGNWVPLDTPDVEPNPAREVLGKLTALQKSELLAALLEEQAE
jgi:Protein of unknown function (DUF2744)